MAVHFQAQELLAFDLITILLVLLRCELIIKHFVIAAGFTLNSLDFTQAHITDDNIFYP